MQAKLARPSRFADIFNRWAIRIGFPLLAFLTPRLPRPFLQWGARCVINTVFFFYPAPKRAVARNLEIVLGEPADSRLLRRLARDVTHNLAYYWVDLLRFSHLPPERAREMLKGVSGRRHLDDARARGKGVVLITAHIGNWELGGALLGSQDEKISVIYVPDQFDHLEHFRSVSRRRSGVEEIAIEPGASFFASLPALRALKDNEVVALQGDRDFDGSGVEVEFFGLPAPFPRGPVLLSLLTGAALIPIFIAYTDDLQVEIEIGEALPVEATGDRAADIRRTLEAWSRVLEKAVLKWPSQWNSFYDYWPSRQEEVCDKAE